jgi:hypothetical protein
VCSLTSPFPVLSINPSWWNLNGLPSPLGAEHKDKPLQEVLRGSNHFPTNVLDHLISLLPRVAAGIPNRVPFISVLNGQKVFLYLRVVPLVNENLEVSSALLTLSEASLSPQVATSIQEHTILSDPVNSTSTTMPAPPTLPPQSGWDMLRKAPFVHTSPGFDQSMLPLSFQGSSPIVDPVWGGTLPFPHSQVLDAPFRSHLSPTLSPPASSGDSVRGHSQGGNQSKNA